MEEFFASLTRRQQMLLLTGVTFGGQESTGAFDHLSPDEAETMKYRAAKLLEIPRDKRIPLLVQEIKRLVTSRKTYLWNAEPSAFARLLAKEKPALRETILRALPVALAEAVREHLPPSAAAPDKELKPGVLAVIRWKLEELLEQASAGAMWKFSDLLLLKPREIYTVVERQGVRALGIAFAAMPKEDRETAFAQLPPDLRVMAQRATDAAEKRALGGSDANALLKQHGFDKAPVDAIRSAGTQRLARACLAQSPDFAARMAERHRPPFAPLFQKWINDERTKNAARGDGGRAEIVAELERLEAKGLVEKPTRLPALKPQKPHLPPPSAASMRTERTPEKERAPLPPQPGLNVKVPSGRKPTPASQRLPSVVIAPKPPSASDGLRRDPIAEREARRAGLAVGGAAAAPSSQPGPAVQGGFRDPIAERNARRAGLSVRSPSGEPPAVDEPRARGLAEAGPPPSARMYRPPPLMLDKDEESPKPGSPPDRGANRQPGPPPSSPPPPERGANRQPGPPSSPPPPERGADRQPGPPSSPPPPERGANRQSGPGLSGPPGPPAGRPASSEPRAARPPPPLPGSKPGRQVLAPLPQRMKDHPRGVGQLPDAGYDVTNPHHRRPGPPRSSSGSQPTADPGGSKLHKMKPLKENRIVKGDSKPAPPVPDESSNGDREPRYLTTGSRPALNMKPLQRVKGGPRPPPLPPRGKGPGRGPGGDKG